MPDFFPAAAGFLAAQGDDAGGAAHASTHPGEFEALADDGLATGFDRAGADEVTEFAEVGIAHPHGVGLEVAQGLVECLGCPLRKVKFASGGDEGADIAAVEVGALVTACLLYTSDAADE